MYYRHDVDDKSLNIYMNGAIKCPYCGHSLHFAKVEKKICTWCGNYVFKDKKAEFEYRIKTRRLAMKNEQERVG